MKRGNRIAMTLLLVLSCMRADASGGPLGIDHEWHYDDHGIWKRSVQKALQYSLIGGEVAGALWEGGDTRLGKTLWQSIDSSVATVVTTEILKRGFSRVRPIDSNGDPDLWFKGHGNQSFPSGEVAAVSAIVTPVVLEYRSDHPGIYALELLPAYDALARMKLQAHWQTDVVAGVLIGTTWGYLAHKRKSPIVLGLLPDGFSVGIRERF